MIAYFCILSAYFCIYLHILHFWYQNMLKYAKQFVHMQKYVEICKICKSIYAEKCTICNSSGPISGPSLAIPARPTLADSCKHFIACQHNGMRLIRGGQLPEGARPALRRPCRWRTARRPRAAPTPTPLACQRRPAA